MRSLVLLPALFVLAACGDDDGDTTLDAGDRRDATIATDAAGLDAGSDPDAAAPDAATPDASTSDASTLDAGGSGDAGTLPDAHTGDGGTSGGWRATTLVPWSRIIGSEPDASVLDVDLVMDGAAAHACASIRMRTGVTTYERRVLYATNEGGAFRVEVVRVTPDEQPAQCSIALFEGAPHVASSATTVDGFALQRRTATGAWEAVAVDLEPPPDDVSQVTVHALRADASSLALVISRRRDPGFPAPANYELRVRRRTASGWGAWIDGGPSASRAGMELEGGVLRGAASVPASAGLWSLDLATGERMTRAVLDGSALAGEDVRGVGGLALVGAPVLLGAVHYDCDGFSCSALVLTHAPEGETATHHVLADRRIGVWSTARCGDDATVMHVDGSMRTLHTSTAGATPVSTTLAVATESTVVDEALGVDCASGRMVLVTARYGELVAFESP
ncbi:hypothetical protein [Sandaracinus amylolyticus]|uniref:Uncharacterized protein n=1 Tax=Sandaracinus amylolyticus TaxID=927083 RepID=A0A0F6SG78_9BACT|nr:hypothetical protein [Sandaracinus amylolyticus]AKF08219.1 hypothetical protein DB32_005368 [Sandaracinus amylolyticus]